MSTSNTSSLQDSTPTVGSSESQLWGWGTFFQELNSFLHATRRQFGHCADSYASYVIERLQIFILSLTHLKEHLQDNLWQITEEHQPTVLGYTSEILFT